MVVDGYEITVGDEPRTDVLGLQRGSRLIEHASFDAHWDSTITPAREAEGISRIDHNQSAAFKKGRDQVRGALRAIVKWLYSQYPLPTTNGVDLGSGQLGEMVNQWLPITGEQRRTWTQVDVYPRSVSENRTLHPDQRIIEGSYLNLAALGINPTRFVTGLSSLDSTHFIGLAVQQIRTLLASEGYFLHIQDVRPFPAVSLQEVQRMGVTSPFQAEVSRSDELVSFITPEGPLGVGELFRRSLGRAVEDAGMRLLLNQWVTAHKTTDEQSNGIIYTVESLLGLRDHREEASVVVTLAQVA